MENKMTNTEHILSLIREWVKDHNTPITKSDIMEMGNLNEWHVMNGLKNLQNQGRLRPTVNKKGWVLIG